MSNFFLFGPRPLNVSPRLLSLFPAISASADFVFSLFYFILFFVITLIKLPGGTLVLYGLGLLVWSVFLRQWNIERVRELLTDQRLTIRMQLDEFDIPRKTVQKLLTQDLRKHRLCSRFVLYHISEKQKQQRLKCCGDFIDTSGAKTPVPENHRHWRVITDITHFQGTFMGTENCSNFQELSMTCRHIVRGA